MYSSVIEGKDLSEQQGAETAVKFNSFTSKSQTMSLGIEQLGLANPSIDHLSIINFVEFILPLWMPALLSQQISKEIISVMVFVISFD